MAVKGTDELTCSAQSGAQIIVQALCCSRKCLLKTDCTSLSQRRFIPSVDEPLQQTLAQAPCLAVLCGVIWSKYEVWEAGVDFGQPERKYSLSHRQLEQTSINNLYTTRQEHLLLSSSEILHCPLTLQLHKGKVTLLTFLHLQQGSPGFKGFLQASNGTVESSPLHRTWHPAQIKYSP